MSRALASCGRGLRLARGGASTGFSARLLSSARPKNKNPSSRTRDLLISGTSICCVLGALYYFESQKEEAAAIRNMSKSVGKVLTAMSALFCSAPSMCLFPLHVWHGWFTHKQASVGGPYALFNQDGACVTDATYHGHYVLLYFGFTYCPDICPNEINKLTKIVNILGMCGNGLRSVPVLLFLGRRLPNIMYGVQYIIFTYTHYSFSWV